MAEVCSDSVKEVPKQNDETAEDECHICLSSEILDTRICDCLNIPICQKCLFKLIESHGHIKCRTCKKSYGVKKDKDETLSDEDLKLDLEIKEMIKKVEKRSVTVRVMPIYDDSSSDEEVVPVPIVSSRSRLYSTWRRNVDYCACCSVVSIFIGVAFLFGAVSYTGFFSEKQQTYFRENNLHIPISFGIGFAFILAGFLFVFILLGIFWCCCCCRRNRPII